MQVHVNRKRLRRILPDAAASIGAARRESRGEGPGPDSLLPQGPKRKNGRRRKMERSAEEPRRRRFYTRRRRGGVGWAG